MEIQWKLSSQRKSIENRWTSKTSASILRNSTGIHRQSMKIHANPQRKPYKFNSNSPKVNGSVWKSMETVRYSTSDVNGQSIEINWNPQKSSEIQRAFIEILQKSVEIFRCSTEIHLKSMSIGGNSWKPTKNYQKSIEICRKLWVTLRIWMGTHCKSIEPSDNPWKS